MAYGDPILSLALALASRVNMKRNEYMSAGNVVYSMVAFHGARGADMEQ